MVEIRLTRSIRWAWSPQYPLLAACTNSSSIRTPQMIHLWPWPSIIRTSGTKIYLLQRTLKHPTITATSSRSLWLTCRKKMSNWIGLVIKSVAANTSILRSKFHSWRRRSKIRAKVFKIMNSPSWVHSLDWPRSAENYKLNRRKYVPIDPRRSRSTRASLGPTAH